MFRTRLPFYKKVCSTGSGVFRLKFAKCLEYFKNEPEAEAFEKFIPLKIRPFWPKKQQTSTCRISDANNISSRSYTFENRNVIRYNLRMFIGIFSATNQQKNKNIQPRAEKTVFFFFFKKEQTTRKLKTSTIGANQVECNI